MKPVLLASLVAASVLLVACADDATKSSVESAITVSSPTEPSLAPSPGFDASRVGVTCAYAGGCEGNVDPSSGTLSVDGKACTGVKASLAMDPIPNVQNLSWILKVESDCGTFEVEGTHFEKYPVSGTASLDDAEGDAAIQLGPMNHVPKKLVGTAKIGGQSIDFRFFFGDEK